MVFLRSALTASLAVLFSLGPAQAASFMNKLRNLSSPARNVLRKATPATPHFVSYSDKYVSIDSALADINVS